MLAGLEADRLRVAELEEQIMKLELSLTALRTEKASVQERLETFKYPVLMLPNELTSEIFIHFLPVYPICPPLTGSFSPTLLTQICRQWRELALGIPALWRALSSWYGATPLKNEAQILHLWLSRSRPCPLSLDLYSNTSSEALTVVATHRTRWQHAELCLSPSHIPLIVGPMPLLQRLDLEIEVPWASPPKFTLSDLPLLRTVALNEHAAASIVLPWAQLTSLTLYGVFPSQCTPILQQTPNLVRCRLSIACDYNDDRQQPDIRLLHLESFVLGGITSADGYLETFIAPALKHLSISDTFLRLDAIADFKSFISKSGCSLQQVFIVEPDLAPASYSEAFPSIQFSFGDDHDENSEF
ncbi:hypothetical protein DFH06DRAFT_1331824 [Mycena polygramma]|nr:hypothetical protein DFH06DRAFT_1331824 [Mycena polygramma]